MVFKQTKKNEIKIKVWPKLLMIFHWMLPVLFILSYLSSLSKQYLVIHIAVGTTIFVMIVWRIFYAFLGPDMARYSIFIASPITLIKHLILVIKGNPPKHLSHSPPAGWMLLLTQLIVFLLFISGVVGFLGIDQYQIFTFQVSLSNGLTALSVHEIVFNFMVLLVVMHLAGVARESQNHKVNLPLSFITGKKSLDKKQQNQWRKLNKKSHFGAFSIVFFTSLLSLLVFIVLFAKPLEYNYKQEQTYTLWMEECASCHEAYHPILLTSTQWQVMLNELEDHYGENAQIDDKDRQKIEQFLTQNSADQKLFKVSYYLTLSDAKAIRDNPFWKDKHHNIEKRIEKDFPDKSSSQCTLCHSDAKSGLFSSLKIKF